MSQPMEVRQRLRDQVAELVGSYPESAEATVVLRGLYRLYFDNKPTANTHEKWFLLSESFKFSAASGTLYEDDKVILKEEADRHYQRPGEAGAAPQA